MLNNRFNLYNGNISSMVTTLPVAASMTSGNTSYTNQAQGYAYKYDQLNRLSDAVAFQNLNPDNHWENNTTAIPKKYLNTFEYDANGNIIHQMRTGEDVTDPFDQLEYKYAHNGGKLISNRLQYVDDFGNAALQQDDIVDQDAGNYQYDPLGNLKYDEKEEISEIIWTVTGKISKIVRTTGSTQPDLEFWYDASGNRTTKVVKPPGSSVENGGTDNPLLWVKTHYVRDAQGNVMAVYDEKYVTSQHSFEMGERPIYGSSRLGVDNNVVDMYASVAPNPISQNILGKKQYEITNHLGNVIATISDRPIQVANGNMIDHFLADVRNTYDYYPFGAPIKERSSRWVVVSGTPTFVNATQTGVGIDEYRYAFNGQERSDEISGKGNHTTATFWEYDSRLGRRWNLDPVDQVSISNYATLSNSPIWYCDPLGNTASPIFDSKTGDYLGSDSEGFAKGDVLYMDKAKYNELSGNNKQVIEHNVAVKNSSYTNSTLPDNEFGMQLFKKSTNTISNAMYKAFEKQKPSLYKNTIEVERLPNNDIARYITALPTEDGGWSDHDIKVNFDQRGTYLNTPGNIYTNFLHEYKGHGVLNLQNADHIQIYQMQANDPSFRFVDGKMRQHILKWIK